MFEYQIVEEHVLREDHEGQFYVTVVRANGIELDIDEAKIKALGLTEAVRRDLKMLQLKNRDLALGDQINEEARYVNAGNRSVKHTYGAEHRDNFID